ncbi:hypothetical protein BGW80DRAFT_883469 [Lactifluus volemus]|nr:hypothetical protein BGW80DRAFT_883469 [Lactifluus volemus]
MKVFSLANVPSLLPLIADFQAIFRRYPPTYGDVIRIVCANLEELDEPKVKMSLIWIIGEYANKIIRGHIHRGPILCELRSLQDASSLTPFGGLGGESSPTVAPAVSTQQEDLLGIF